MKGWRDYLQSNYSSFAEWESYSDMYGLAARLGFEDARAAWDENPMIQGSANPSDFKRVRVRDWRASDFLRGYVVCALWSSIDEQPDGNGGPPMDEKYSGDDVAPEALQDMRNDCARFLRKARRLIARADDGYSLERAGHDFWLTRNGHGAGFWDREELRGFRGEELTKLAEEARESDLYVGDDGRLYV